MDYLLNGEYITQLTIDWSKMGKVKIRDIQYITIDREGILISYTTSYEQSVNGKSKYPEGRRLYKCILPSNLKKCYAEIFSPS